jgi:hypothetical protein
MWHLVVLVLTWRSAVLALQLGLDDVKDICPGGVDTCNGRNIPYDTDNEYVSESVFHDESSLVIVKNNVLWKSGVTRKYFIVNIHLKVTFCSISCNH